MGTLQKFASVHANVHNHFNSECHFVDRSSCKLLRSAALAESPQPHGLNRGYQSPNFANRGFVHFSLIRSSGVSAITRRRLLKTVSRFGLSVRHTIYCSA